MRGKATLADLQQIARFRAELQVYSKLRSRGASHDDAMHRVFGDAADVGGARQLDAAMRRKS